jgi:starvation-inducible DNA-binding protein
VRIGGTLEAIGPVDQAVRNKALERGGRLSLSLAHSMRKETDMATSATRGQAPSIDIGIDEADRKQIAEGLSRLLADSYTLYLKTHNFHWNVTGPMFNTLHLMFEGQYTELAAAVDLIAERIRALGFPAPGSYRDYARLSSIQEAEGVPSANEMIAQLVKGQEQVVKTARSVWPVVERANDEPTADLLTQRMQVHEKTAWMLRSMLEQ